MDAPPLTKEQVAALLGLTGRRISEMARDGSGPPRNEDGSYPPERFGDWWRRREEVGSPDARIKRARAEREEIELAQLRGELVPLAGVVRHWQTMAAAMRNRLLTLPPTAAPVIAPTGKVADVQAKLERMVHEALDEIAGDGAPPGTAAG